MQPVPDTGVMDGLPEQSPQIDGAFGPFGNLPPTRSDEDIVGDRFPLPGVGVNGADWTVDALPTS